ncbi:hypothetical protein SCMC78_20920 [Streptomyces sp. CMC78]|uniref:Resolvase/invertase-type recombinase catalytic domain-containing protein n=1 Tax=Streptomyces sp. CMC78 TaxID=3231512 RepID=A0AB33KL36_9ACTN
MSPMAAPTTGSVARTVAVDRSESMGLLIIGMVDAYLRAGKAARRAEVFEGPASGPGSVGRGSAADAQQ